MGGPIAAVLDASALVTYARGPLEGLPVAELISEVAREGRRAAISIVALSEAMAHPSIDQDLGQAVLEWYLTERSEALTMELTPREVTATAALAHDFRLDIPLAHSMLLALRHEAHFATADPATAARVLGDDWPVLDVSAVY